MNGDSGLISQLAQGWMWDFISFVEESGKCNKGEKRPIEVLFKILESFIPLYSKCCFSKLCLPLPMMLEMSKKQM
jgi:hypothetical protein